MKLIVLGFAFRTISYCARFVVCFIFSSLFSVLSSLKVGSNCLSFVYVSRRSNWQCHEK